MNYSSMTLPQLAKELKARKLGNTYLYNELNIVHGELRLPPTQEAARQEAITLLKEYDNNKFSVKKMIVIIVTTITVLAGLATIFSIFI